MVRRRSKQVAMLETHHTPPLSVRVMFARTQTSLEGKVSEDTIIMESKGREKERQGGREKEMVAISQEESVAN